MKIQEIQALVALFEASSLTELTLSRDNTQLVLKREHAAAPPGPTQSARAPAPAPDAALDTASTAPTPPSGHAVTSPLVGTFYLRPSPEEPAYIEVGRAVKAGDTLCIVEAMKVMNEIKADRAGTVVEIAAQDGSVVEYGQTLMYLGPA